MVREKFLDDAALAALANGRTPAHAYVLARALWEEREKCRGQPSERELVVQWLNRQGRAQPGEKASTLFAAADAIKAGHHLEAGREGQAAAAEAVGKPHLADALRERPERG